MQSPAPAHIIRTHSASVTSIAFSTDNERLYSGDGSGRVIVTSTRSLRPLASWNAHTDGILGVQEWEKADSILTHGRDNKLHVWGHILAVHTIGDAATTSSLPCPELRYSLDVNALNFCRFSLFVGSEDLSMSSSSATPAKALIAVPNLVESSLSDIWELPSCSRIHAAVGKLETSGTDGRGESKTGILMSLSLFRRDGRFYLVSAYESGEVIFRRYVGDRDISIEGQGWECVWRTRQHNESVMAMAVSIDGAFALSVSADHTVVRYDLKSEGSFDKYRIKQAGNASIALRHDGRVCAVGGWDGKIRLFSTKTFKSLGSLTCHSKTCQALAFTHPPVVPEDHNTAEETDEEMTSEEIEARCRWLAAGSQDNRLSIWELMDFRKNKQ